MYQKENIFLIYNKQVVYKLQCIYLPLVNLQEIRLLFIIQLLALDGAQQVQY